MVVVGAESEGVARIDGGERWRDGGVLEERVRREIGRLSSSSR